MTRKLDEALDILVARTGHERFRRLCDPTDPAYDPSYPPWVIAQAGMEPPAPAPDEPGLLRKAANLGKAVIQHAMANLPEADDATVKSRMAICRACEMFDAENVVCRACGCFLNVKIRWQEQACPLKKW